MPNKVVSLPGIGAVTLRKRRGLRSLRLSITAAGEVRVTVPYWLPYEAGLTYARSQIDWIVQHQASRDSILLQHGQAVGKTHRLVFEPTLHVTKVSSRVSANLVRIVHPTEKPHNHPSVQASAQKACIRALRMQAEDLLPPRLHELALARGFNYRGVQIKRLTSRWGSCDSNANIVLNLFLMQLPWHLIDYVLLHELTHTRVLRHGPDFWQAMQKHEANVQALRREIRSYSPVVTA